MLIHQLLGYLLVRKYIQERKNIRKMKIDKSLIILALQTLSEQVVNADISEHDESLDRLIRIKEQIKLIKEWKK